MYVHCAPIEFMEKSSIMNEKMGSLLADNDGIKVGKPHMRHLGLLFGYRVYKLNKAFS